MATASIYQSRPVSHFGYPQPPPSPPMDETPKCSLPSISNLLVMADQGSPTTEYPPRSAYSSASCTKPDTRPNSSHHASQGPSRASFPPTPPMSIDTSFEGHNSPSAKSVGQASLASASSYYYETTPPVEDVQRRPATYAPSHPPAGSYYPPTQQPAGLVYQKPLPQTYTPVPVSVTPSSGANPWQHHHYISPSSAASFPQSQDRYICQTCNKAFSRPSSLRIHSHSHTGEKPFKCPHMGCGKAFSVRSNMKRHERGCHTFDGSVPPLR